MTIVGDKNRFGIEFELDRNKLVDALLAPWLYGHVCWWCSGERVGRFEVETTLRDVKLETERFLAYAGSRRNDKLMELPIEIVFGTLTRALYDDHGQPDEQVEADERSYRRYEVRPEVDVFNAWSIFLVENARSARLLWRQASDPRVRAQELACGEFDGVVRSFVVALKAVPGSPSGALGT